MKNKMNIVFFGSFLHYSAYVLETLIKTDFIEVLGVVTTPPLIDKKGEHKNPVQLLAEANGIPVFTPEKLTDETLADIEYSILDIGNNDIPTNIKYQTSSINTSIDLFLTAGYGKLLPVNWLKAPKIASLNLHLSLLPQYRGANPGEWALLMGETESGVTLMEMSPQFDTGNIIATYTVPIESNDTRETLYEKLYREGGVILPNLLDQYVKYKTGNNFNATMLQNKEIKATELHLPPLQQPLKGFLYARRLNRDDGFISWEVIQAAMRNQDIAEDKLPSLYREIRDMKYENDRSGIASPLSLLQYIERSTRALAGFPTLWTEIQTSKGPLRMKILAVSVSQGKLILETVHIAGKQPARWNEVKNILA